MLEVIHPSNAQWVCLGFNGEKEREEEGEQQKRYLDGGRHCGVGEKPGAMDIPRDP